MLTDKAEAKIVPIIVLAAMVITGMFLLTEAGAATLTPFNTNQSGLTYGVTIDPETGEPYATEPDLRAVEASNGKNGYVYTSELNATLDMLRSKSIEELQAMESEHADTMVRISAEKLGVDALSHEDAATYLMEIETLDTMEQADDKARAAMSSNIAQRIACGDLSGEALASLEDTGIIDSRTADEIDARVNTAAISSDVTAVSVAQAISIPKDIFDSIVRETREATAIQLTVYESDGITEVGSIPFYLM